MDVFIFPTQSTTLAQSEKRGNKKQQVVKYHSVSDSFASEVFSKKNWKRFSSH